MLTKWISLCLLLAFSAACSSTQQARGPVKPKPFVTPYEYYSKTRPAVMTERDKRDIQKAEAVHTTSEDTKEDHTQAIIIGTLVGVSVIGGTVAGILLLK